MITLTARDGCLCSVPSDSEGQLLLPFGEGTSWCATVTGKPSQFERHFWERPRPRRAGLLYVIPAHARPGVVVEFGVNHKRPEPPQSPSAAWEAAPLAAAEEPKRRRWYGVIADLSAERLKLAPCEDVKQAMAVAISYEAEPILPHLREQIGRMVENIKGGALTELGVLADLLDDLSDPRGRRIREALRETVDSLFPECKPEEKKANLKLKASGNSEVQPT